jgi:hypothetical protein
MSPSTRAASHRTSHQLLVVGRTFLISNQFSDAIANVRPAHTAPQLPALKFLRVQSHNDMNGSLATSDNLHTAHTTPPRTATGPAMPSYSSPRNVSGPFSVESPAMTTADPNTSWNRPAFHSTQGSSKTSQYIDKIVSENERLHRELKAEKLAREEETRRVSAAQSRAEDSRAEFQRFQVLAETNERAIERKDRKLGELKATLDAEILRRKSAESRAEEALKMLGDTRSETQRQLSQAYDMKGLADTNLDAARDGFKRINESHDKKVKDLLKEINELRNQRIEDGDKIKRQAIVSDQLNHQIAQTKYTHTKRKDLMATYKEEHGKELATYKEEHRQEIAVLVAEAERLRLALPAKEREAQKLVDAMQATKEKMVWVMNQHKRQSGS